MCFVPFSSLLRQIKRLFRSCCFFFVSKIHLSKTGGIKCILPLNGIRCLRNSIRSSLSRSLSRSSKIFSVLDFGSFLLFLLTLRALVCAIPPRPASVWQSCLAIASSPSGLIRSWLELQNGRVSLAIAHHRENARGSYDSRSSFSFASK